MTDNSIIEGLCARNPRITRQHFYGYCKRAYAIFDYKYHLRNKVGLDFFSLAHDYYIHLLKYNFKPLLDKPNDTALSAWMTRGFHFVVLDALKAYNREFEHLSNHPADLVLEYVLADDTQEHLLPDVTEAVAAHYEDPTMGWIARMVLLEGYKQKEVAEQLGLTPSAINQRYRMILEEVVTPFVIEHYGQGLEQSHEFMGGATSCNEMPMDFCLEESIPMEESTPKRESMRKKASAHMDVHKEVCMYMKKISLPHDVLLSTTADAYTWDFAVFIQQFPNLNFLQQSF